MFFTKISTNLPIRQLVIFILTAMPVSSLIAVESQSRSSVLPELTVSLDLHAERLIRLLSDSASPLASLEQSPYFTEYKQVISEEQKLTNARLREISSWTKLPSPLPPWISDCESNLLYWQQLLNVLFDVERHRLQWVSWQERGRITQVQQIFQSLEQQADRYQKLIFAEIKELSTGKTAVDTRRQIAFFIDVRWDFLVSLANELGTWTTSAESLFTPGQNMADEALTILSKLSDNIYKADDNSAISSSEQLYMLISRWWQLELQKKSAAFAKRLSERYVQDAHLNALVKILLEQIKELVKAESSAIDANMQLVAVSTRQRYARAFAEHTETQSDTIAWELSRKLDIGLSQLALESGDELMELDFLRHNLLSYPIEEGIGEDY